MTKWVSIFTVCCITSLAQTRSVPVADAGGANLPAQTIGANDLVAVSVYDAPELTRTVRIGADGEIRLPMLKRRVKAEGLMPSELETAIADALKAEDLIVDPFVTVTIAEYHSRPISVVGAVKRPTTFQALGNVTLLEALAQAEGLTMDAGPDILVTRSKPLDSQAAGGPAALTKRISVRALIDGADPDLNLKLAGGDEVRVPEVGKVFVLGNVKKPGAFPVQNSDDTTVLKLLSLAEGLTPYANKQAFIYRRESGAASKNEIPIELKNIMERKAPDVPLQADDILYIPDNKGRRATLSALEKILAFGAATASGVLIYSTIR